MSSIELCRFKYKVVLLVEFNPLNCRISGRQVLSDLTKLGESTSCFVLASENRLTKLKTVFARLKDKY